MQWFSLNSVKLSQEPQQSEAKVGSQEKRKLEKKIMYYFPEANWSLHLQKTSNIRRPSWEI